MRSSDSLAPDDLMLVGAHCRDILQANQGVDAGLRGTDDVDFGIAIADWSAFDDLVEKLDPLGNTGIRFDVDGVPADLMPFGDVEDPHGTVTPKRRRPP